MNRRLLALLCLSVLPSCSSQTGPTGTDAPSVEAVEPKTQQRQGTLVVARGADIGSLNPIVSQSAGDAALYENNLLMALSDTEFDCRLKRQPGIAKSWAWSSDGTVISVTLRDDIQWADGTPVTADDVAYTYELIADPIVASPRRSYLARLKPDGRPKVIDQTHIEWHFTEAYDQDAQWAHTTVHPIPKHVLVDADRATLRGHAFGKAPLASGPWKLATAVPGERIVLEPNEHFTGPVEMRPRLERVVLRVIPEYATRLMELQNGGVDMASVQVGDADRVLADNPNLRMERLGWRFMEFVTWNLSNPLFADKRVRYALAHAVNTQELIDKLLTTESGAVYGRPSVGTISPELCDVHNDGIVPLAFDLEKSRQLLAEAGWTDTDGDGIVDKEGKPFAFTLTTNTGSKRRADSQILIQAQLKAIGVAVSLEKEESNVFYGHLRKREYEAALAGWSAALFVDPSDVWGVDEGGEPYEFNLPGYRNPEVQALIDKGLQTPDPALAAPIWRDMQRLIYEDQPYVFLYWRDELVGIDRRFENTEIDIVSGLHNLHNWSVPNDKLKYRTQSSDQAR